MSVVKSLIKEVKVGCGKCHQPFSSKTLLAVNAEADPHLVEQLRDLSLLTSKCTNCGYEAHIPAVFLYDDPSADHLLLVVPDNYQIRYLLVQELFDVLLEDYSKPLPEVDKQRLQKASRRVVPLLPFLLMIKSPAVRGTGMGVLHFYPFPRVDLPTTHSSFEDAGPAKVGQFEVGLVEGNYPDFYQSLWSLIKDDFQFDKSYLRGRDIQKDQTPVATYGIPEIIFYVGASVVVPIFVGVLSTLISTLVLEKRQAKRELEAWKKRASDDKNPKEFLIAQHAEKLLKAQNNDMTPSDKVCIRIRVHQSSSEYVFRGTLHDVCRELKRFRCNMLHSVTLPGDCHVCNYVGSAYADVTLETDTVGSIENLKRRFGKLFNKTTRVRYASGDQADYLYETLRTCARAKDLMDKKEYEAAAILLQEQLRGEESSLELLYNYALCAKELGRDESADSLFEQVLVRAINLPSLEDAGTLIMGVFQAQPLSEAVDGKDPAQQEPERDK